MECDTNATSSTTLNDFNDWNALMNENDWNFILPSPVIDDDEENLFFAKEETQTAEEIENDTM